MSRVRTFLAVEVSDAVRARLKGLQDSLARAGASARWTADFHLTVLFLGDVEDRDLDKLCRAVAAVCAEHPAFTLGVEGVGCFPNPSRPRVLWAGVTDGAAELTALNEALAARLTELNLYAGDDHRFNPHVTLGRVKGDGGPIAAALEKKAGWSGGSCDVGQVLVMASDLRPGGPVYSVLSTASLA